MSGAGWSADTTRDAAQVGAAPVRSAMVRSRGRAGASGIDPLRVTWAPWRRDRSSSTSHALRPSSRRAPSAHSTATAAAMPSLSRAVGTDGVPEGLLVGEQLFQLGVLDRRGGTAT